MKNVVIFPNGKVVPALGQGTWNMGDSLLNKQEEIKALRKGIELGMTVIDTAESMVQGVQKNWLPRLSKESEIMYF